MRSSPVQKRTDEIFIQTKIVKLIFTFVCFFFVLEHYYYSYYDYNRMWFVTRYLFCKIVAAEICRRFPAQQY